MKKKILNGIANLVLIAALSCVISLAVTGARTGHSTVFGFRGFYIMSESMEPTIMTDQVVLGRSVKADDVAVGDVVAYERDGVIIIHRVKDIIMTNRGKMYQFKGDNNNEPDNKLVSADQILYRIICY